LAELDRGQELALIEGEIADAHKADLKREERIRRSKAEKAREKADKELKKEASELKKNAVAEKSAAEKKDKQ
ncbi:MAG: hypothetical protein J6S19_02280, partial [Lentisphaeria bacterium]|nr:hypothetical protein [Lentisphaeria bacterium]